MLLSCCNRVMVRGDPLNVNRSIVDCCQAAIYKATSSGLRSRAAWYPDAADFDWRPRCLHFGHAIKPTGAMLGEHPHSGSTSVIRPPHRFRRVEAVPIAGLQGWPNVEQRRRQGVRWLDAFRGHPTRHNVKDAQDVRPMCALDLDGAGFGTRGGDGLRVVANASGKVQSSWREARQYRVLAQAANPPQPQGSL